jgi:hypothetical protein
MTYTRSMGVDAADAGCNSAICRQPRELDVGAHAAKFKRI